MPKVVFINGIRDDGIVRVNRIINNNTLQYINEGSCNVYRMLHDIDFDASVLVLDANPTQDIHTGSVDLLFNQISDPDTHTVSLAKAKKVCDLLRDGACCINHPARIKGTSRERLHERLQDIADIVVPRTVRLSPAGPSQVTAEVERLGWSYPYLIRRCGDHNAKSLQLVHSPDDATGIDPACFEGECYLTEFIDYSNAQGVFVKYRFVCVEGEAFIRHVMYSDQWEVHAHVRRAFMKQNPGYFEREKGILSSFETDLKPAVRDRIEAVARALGLDYFGIDCSIDANGDLVIFEANANMNLLFNPYPEPNPWQATVDRIHDAVVSMIETRAGCRQYPANADAGPGA